MSIWLCDHKRRCLHGSHKPDWRNSVTHFCLCVSPHSHTLSGLTAAVLPSQLVTCSLCRRLSVWPRVYPVGLYPVSSKEPWTFPSRLPTQDPSHGHMPSVTPCRTVHPSLHHAHILVSTTRHILVSNTAHPSLDKKCPLPAFCTHMYVAILSVSHEPSGKLFSDSAPSTVFG